MSKGVPEIGRMTSSIVRYKEFLNEATRIRFGILHFNVALVKMRSLIIEMKGVMPLPPLTITRVSCLQKY